MEIFDLLYYVSLVLLPVAGYFLFLKHSTNQRFFTNRDWLYLVKYILATSAIKKYQQKCKKSLNETTLKTLEDPRIRTDLGSENHFIYGVDQNGNSLSLRLTIRAGLVGDVFICLRLANGAIYTLPGDELSKSYSLSSWHWKTKDLHLEILEPFKRLRVTYNGLLGNANHDIEHVRFNFIWSSAAAPLFHPQDASDALLADGLARHPWRDANWISLMGDQKGYEQFGGMRGVVTIANEEIFVNLATCRTRFWCKDEKMAVKKSIHLFVAAKDGAVISLWVKNYKDGCTDLQSGNVIMSNGKIHPITSSDIRLICYQDYEELPPVFTVHVKVKGKTYRGVFHVDKKKTVTSSDQVVLSNSPADCDFNTQQARSLVEFWSRGLVKTRDTPRPLVLENKTKTWSRCYVTHLTDENAKIVNLTGGKGCSLALLKSIEDESTDAIQVAFTVPDGFVVTVDAFKAQMYMNFHVKKAVAILEDICYGRAKGDLQDACAETVATIKQAAIHPDVKTKILKALNKLKKNHSQIVWAVRSSAIGEDSPDLSAAGQNATFLGVAAPDAVLAAVSACWASLYSLQSVKYRHRHGLPVTCQMGVVVQRMVPADCAGVLFTCHPTTASPAHVVITANHGLGESVVSGRSEPDTIVVERTLDDDLTIGSKVAGSKRTKVKMAPMGGVLEVEGEGDEFCLSDNQALDLAKVGVFLEGKFGGAQDIEFAFYKGGLYLLQSRPVTTLNSWTRFELERELDAGVLSEEMVYSTANAGEVLPGAVSALTTTTVVEGIEKGFQKLVEAKVDPYASQSLRIFQHHLFLDVIFGFHKIVEDEPNLILRSIGVAVFGKPITDDYILSIAKSKFGVASGLLKLQNLYQTVAIMYNNEKNVRLCTTLARTSQVGIDKKRDTLKDIYVKISDSIRVYFDIVHLHACCTRSSVSYQIFTLATLAGKNEDFDVGHYADAAMLLSSCDDVISAEIPNTLDAIVTILNEENRVEDFLKIEPRKGLKWLQNNSTAAAEVFDSFLKKHGHRGPGEFDLCNETWITDLSDVIKMIQANCRNQTRREKTTARSIDDVISGLVTPLSWQSRRFLKFLMKKNRRNVGLREQTKSETIRFVGKLRTAYKYLGRKMALGGLIPEPNLIFHFTHHEIGQILDGYERTSVLITKALKRRQLLPTWNQLKFPEISHGIPVSENREFVPRTGSEVMVRGTPACSGEVQARACVITDLAEIDQLEKGDVLITYSTDIGWSPYFPMLKGIVTELGGLVSHGAVIAREYGLPCIVGAKGATILFKTGDNVILSGKTGTIELV